MFTYLGQIWKSKDLRDKILFTIFAIIIFRLAAQVSIPGIDLDAVSQLFKQNQLLGAFNILTGGSAENFSIVMMGLSPYINASIILQLMTVVIPKLEALSKEGEQGQKKISQYTRWLTLPLALVQSYGMIILLNSSAQVPIIQNIGDPTVVLPIMLTITTGTVFLMWLGELISEKGISNGISILIFAGIITAIPQQLGSQLFLINQDNSRIVAFTAAILITIALAVFVILVTEAYRRIPITYARGGLSPKGNQAELPIRVNQAGMIPIIFGVAVVSFPTIVAQFLINARSEWLRNLASWFTANFNATSPLYIFVYFLMVVFFTYFYVSITFNPEQVAENIQKNGGYVPGIRPGKETAEYLEKISGRMNLWGGLFIAFVAVFPLLLGFFIPSLGRGHGASTPLLLSGAGMIIISGVVLEILRQINAQLVMHDYKKFY